MKVLFMGTTVFSCVVLEELINCGYEVIGVVTQPDRPFGRKKELRPSPVKEMAIRYDIAVYQPENIKMSVEEINNLNADLIVTCAYGQFVPLAILKHPKYEAVNVHASILPKYRGGAPIHWAIIKGETETGVTLMKMEAGMDSGDIIGIETCNIDDTDTMRDVEKKLMDASVRLIRNKLPLYIEKPHDTIIQDESQVTFAYALQKDDEFISFDRSTDDVYNHIRGLIHWPIGYALLDNQRVKFHGVSKSKGKGIPGEIISIDELGVEIATKDGSVTITDIQPFGKGVINGKDIVNGFKEKWIGKIFNENS